MNRFFSINKHLVPIIFITVGITAGCAPSFRSFKQVPTGTEGFIQHRVHASGNATVPGDSVALSVELYERKLNGGITAQIIGNSQFIIVPTNNKRLYFLNPANGKEITSLPATSSVGAAPALEGQLVYFAEQAGSDMLTCFNLVNGKRVWSMSLHDPFGSPIIDGDELFMASRDGKIYCLNRLTGAILWQYHSKRQVYATVAVDSARVVFGNDRGDIICLKRENGDPWWSFQTQGAIAAQPLIDQFVFCGSLDGTMYALDPVSGEQKWIFATKGAIHTTPVKLENQLVFGSNDANIYSLNSEDGSILWFRKTSGIVQSSPIAVGRDFIAANSAGEVIHMDNGGNIKMSFAVKGSVEAPPAYIGDRLFIATTQRKLYVYGPPELAVKPVK